MPSFIFAILLSLMTAPVVHAQDRCASVIQKSCSESATHFPDGTGALTRNNFKSKVEEIIQPTKDALNVWITNNVSDPLKRQQLKARIDSLEVRVISDCRAEETSAGEHRSLQRGMSYNSHGNFVTFCFDFFKGTPSEYSLVQAMAHEMAHSIDPCQLRKKVGVRMGVTGVEHPEVIRPPSTIPPYKTLECLLSDDSIGFGKIRSSKSNDTSPVVTPDICQGIRATEGFSDYLASEVVDSFLKGRWSRTTLTEKENGLANIFASHCSAKDKAIVDPYKVHMNPRVRLEWLLLSHEGIRKNLECTGPAPKKYCGKKERGGSSMDLNYPATEYDFTPGNR